MYLEDAIWRLLKAIVRLMLRPFKYIINLIK